MSSLNDFTKKQFPKYAAAAKELEQPSPNFPFPTRGVCAAADTKPTPIQMPALIYKFVLLKRSQPT